MRRVYFSSLRRVRMSFSLPLLRSTRTHFPKDINRFTSFKIHLKSFPIYYFAICNQNIFIRWREKNSFGFANWPRNFSKHQINRNSRVRLTSVNKNLTWISKKTKSQHDYLSTKKPRHETSLNCRLNFHFKKKIDSWSYKFVLIELEFPEVLSNMTETGVQLVNLLFKSISTTMDSDTEVQNVCSPRWIIDGYWFERQPSSEWNELAPNFQLPSEFSIHKNKFNQWKLHCSWKSTTNISVSV